MLKITSIRRAFISLIGNKFSYHNSITALILQAITLISAVFILLLLILE